MITNQRFVDFVESVAESMKKSGLYVFGASHNISGFPWETMDSVVTVFGIHFLVTKNESREVVNLHFDYGVGEKGEKSFADVRIGILAKTGETRKRYDFNEKSVDEIVNAVKKLF